MSKKGFTLLLVQIFDPGVDVLQKTGLNITADRSPVKMNRKGTMPHPWDEKQNKCPTPGLTN